VNDATSLSVTGLKWFKIQEDGYNPSTGEWAVDKLIRNGGKWTLTIPSCIPPGDYLMRHELIGAFLLSPLQLYSQDNPTSPPRCRELSGCTVLREFGYFSYHSGIGLTSVSPQMECAQLRITGGGSASPATVNFPGAYSGTSYTGMIVISIIC
jgi:cellulase